VDRSARTPPNQRNVGHFVGRRDELNTLLVSTLKTSSKSVGVISVFGKGGIGKSTLLRQFERFLRNDEAFSHIRSSFVDFGISLDREEWAPLIWVRNDLAAQGVCFPRFDFGFQLFWSAAKPARPPPALEHAWLREAPDPILPVAHEIDQECSTWWTAPIPVDHASFQQIPFLRWALAKARRIVVDEELAERLVLAKDSLSALFEGTFCERLRKPAEILHLLPQLLAEDLADHVRREPEHRFVVIFDAYDQLDKERPAPTLQSACPAERAIEAIIRKVSGTLVAVSGRERFIWRHTRNEYKRIKVIRVELNGLSEKKTEALLDGEGINGSHLAEMVLNASRIGDDCGHRRVSPILINVMLRRWRARCDHGAPLEAEDLEVSASDQWGRFREQLDQLIREQGGSMLSTLKRLSLCSWFDRDIFDALNADLPGELRCTTWSEVVALPYVAAADVSGTFVIHDFYRGAIAAGVRLAQARNIHETMIRHLEARISSAFFSLTDP
jgi:hypothetical protein